ncbi:MAG: hypothetical protein LLF94_10440 [Chlamydiales bacterium]|nr:hypothetical protein [Chlamydiales bacterium]
MPTAATSYKQVFSIKSWLYRIHLTSKDVQAAPPDFAGLAIERKTALVHGVLRPEVAQILDMAKQLHWPIILF